MFIKSCKMIYCSHDEWNKSHFSSMSCGSGGGKGRHISVRDTSCHLLYKKKNFLSIFFSKWFLRLKLDVSSWLVSDVEDKQRLAHLKMRTKIQAIFLRFQTIGTAELCRLKGRFTVLSGSIDPFHFHLLLFSYSLYQHLRKLRRMTPRSMGTA